LDISQIAEKAIFSLILIGLTFLVLILTGTTPNEENGELILKVRSHPEDIPRNAYNMRGWFQFKILTDYSIVEFESDFIKYLLGTV
jgi:hypothetical protein